MQTLREGD